MSAGICLACDACFFAACFLNTHMNCMLRRRFEWFTLSKYFVKKLYLIVFMGFDMHSKLLKIFGYTKDLSLLFYPLLLSCL